MVEYSLGQVRNIFTRAVATSDAGVLDQEARSEANEAFNKLIDALYTKNFTDGFNRGAVQGNREQLEQQVTYIKMLEQRVGELQAINSSLVAANVRRGYNG